MKEILVDVELIRADLMLEEEKVRYGLDKEAKGMVAVESYITRDLVITEVNTLVDLFNKDPETAYNFYEKEHAETIEKFKKHKREITDIKRRTPKMFESMQELRKEAQGNYIENAFVEADCYDNCYNKVVWKFDKKDY